MLRRGGVRLFNVWDRIEENEFAHTVTVTAALAGLYPADPLRFMARTPHGYFDRAAISADLASAGVHCSGTFRDDGRAPLSSEIETRAGAGAGPAEATAVCAAAIGQRYGGGAVDTNKVPGTEMRQRKRCSSVDALCGDLCECVVEGRPGTHSTKHGCNAAWTCA